MMGNLVKKNAINTLNVKALRFGETYLNDDVTEKEKDIANMEIDEYIENIEICETEDQREGLRVKAPGGLPTNSMDDVCFFKRTKVMNFEAALEFRTGEIEQPKVRVEGFDAEEFSACVWGGATLKRVEKHKPIYAYGIAKFKNTEYALYIEKNEKKSMIINLDEENERKSKFKANKKDKHLRSLVYLLKRKQGRPVAYSRWQDFSPIKKGLQDIEARIVEASGSKAAILNYGNFLQSNMHGGFRRYRKIMWETYHSVIPKLVRTFMPDMFSAPNLIEVNVSGEIVFEGERCVNTVKYIRTGNSGRTIIDCKGSKAFVRFEDEEDDEDSYDEYTEMMLDD